MVNLSPIVAVLCLAVAAQAGDDLPAKILEVINKDGEQYKLYKHYSEKLKLDAKKAATDTHTGLNIDRKDAEVDKDELGLFYWHADLKFAVEKFIKLFDDGKSDGKIEVKELEDDMKKKPIAVALIECTYVVSKGLRESCYADQLLTYAALVMEEDDVKKFYESLNTDGKPGLSKEEVMALKHKENYDPAITTEELGGHDSNGVTIKEFTDYVTQESVNDDFRRCRTKADASGSVDFDNACLLEELVEYTNDDLTELDMAVLFRAIDEDNSGTIKEAEMKKFVGEDQKKVDLAMHAMDMSLTTPPNTAAEIDYGEFRTYLRSPTVLVQLEKECTEKLKEQVDEIKCLYNELKTLVSEGHDEIWLVVPDLDQTIVFEILDSNNNGKIDINELPFENEQAKKRFFDEADGDDSKYVCLEESNEYLDYPHMVYGTADCLMETRADPTKRGGCFSKEVGEVIDNFKFVDRTAWEDWFNFYDTGKNKRIDKTDELKKNLGKDDLADLFLKELGQGGPTVSLFEFEWYVKQQDLADRYEKDSDLNLKAVTEHFDEAQQKALNKLLTKYIEEDLTEYDIEHFFDALDKKIADRKDAELTKEDFDPDVWKKVEPLLKKIDGVEPQGDHGENVHFREFWLWLNSPNTGADSADRKLVKDIFEKECTIPKKTQKDEIDCYTKTFKEAAKFG